MTPNARVAAAIEVLDRIISGEPTAKTLTTWARGNRFAGSKDRAAIRDLVFNGLRQRQSAAYMGGELGAGLSGRSIMIGLMRLQDEDPATLFNGVGYGPAALTEAEAACQPDLTSASTDVRLDCPEWLYPQLHAQYGADLKPILTELQRRAPVFLRVNLAKSTIEEAIAALKLEDIEASPHDLSPSALSVRKNARRVQLSRAFQQGLVEVQDAASQAVVDLLPLKAGQKMLDYCAGGGGKTLAMAGRVKAQFFAHDVNQGRMVDLQDRAERASINVSILTQDQVVNAAPFDLTLCDVPCSGTGAWRRNPADKWLLGDERLQDLMEIQADILNHAAAFVPAAGILAYVTCSLLACENGDQIEAFLRDNPSWHLKEQRQFTPLTGGDGLFVAILRNGDI